MATLFLLAIKMQFEFAEMKYHCCSVVYFSMIFEDTEFAC